MFTFLRSKKKSITNIILVGFLALLMMGWGANLYGGKNRQAQTDAAIKVNGQEITYAEFNEQLQNIRQLYKQRFGAAFDQIASSINLEQQAVDSAIDQTLGQSFIKSLNLVVSKHQIESKIFSLPFFQTQGLSQESYRQFLQAVNLSGDQLEQAMREEIANDMLGNVLTDISTPTTAEFRNWLANQNTKFDFTYAEIGAESFAAQAAPKDDTELNSYFEENKELYRKPKSVRFSYVKFKPADFESKVVIAEEDVVELYHARKPSFGDKTLEEVRPQLEAELRAGDAPQYSHVEAQNFFDRFIEIKDSKSLADFAKEKGFTILSSGSLLLPTELPNGDKESEGLTARLLSASIGEPQLVELKDADFIAVVDETKESYIPPLAEVKAGVLASYKSKRSKELAKESADKLLAAITAEQSTNSKLSAAELADRLSAKAKTLHGEIKTEKGLSMGDDSGASPVFAAPSTKQTIFGLSAQNPLANKVFELGDKFYVILFAGSKPATEEDLKKVYAEFRETERSERTGRLIGGIRRALRKDADIWIDKNIMDKAAG